ncbi:MAG: DUF962 domain-containing protein [Planctomycetota bacterium]
MSGLSEQISVVLWAALRVDGATARVGCSRLPASPPRLAEHRDPGDRALHFLGTTWLFFCVGVALAKAPLAVAASLAAMTIVAWYASTRVERRRAAFPEMVLMFVAAMLGDPVLLPLGIVGGYGLAWVGHFVVEGNKPAAFRYPVWSFLSDFRVWGRMVTGRLWTGDPLATDAMAADGLASDGLAAAR